MTGEFMLGLYYGALCGALPCLAFVAWDADRRVQEYIAGGKST